MSFIDELNALKGKNRQLGNRFIITTEFLPLSAAEYRELSQSPTVLKLLDPQIDRLWIKPISRMLQQKFRIDQSVYTTGTDPSLADLEEDFKVALALTIDKLAANPDEILGRQSVTGAGSAILDEHVPLRARQLLDRYKVESGRVGRS